MVGIGALCGQILFSLGLAAIEHVLVVALLHNTANLILSMRLSVGADFATQCIFNVTLHLILTFECIALSLGVVLAQRVPDAANVAIDAGLRLLDLKASCLLVPVLGGVADSLVFAVIRTYLLDVHCLHIGGVAFFDGVNGGRSLRFLFAIRVLVNLIWVLTSLVASLGVITPLALFDGLLCCQLRLRVIVITTFIIRASADGIVQLGGDAVFGIVVNTLMVVVALTLGVVGDHALVGTMIVVALPFIFARISTKRSFLVILGIDLVALARGVTPRVCTINALAIVGILTGVTIRGGLLGILLVILVASFLVRAMCGLKRNLLCTIVFVASLLVGANAVRSLASSFVVFLILEIATPRVLTSCAVVGVPPTVAHILVLAFVFVVAISIAVVLDLVAIALIIKVTRVPVLARAASCQFLSIFVGHVIVVACFCGSFVIGSTMLASSSLSPGPILPSSGIIVPANILGFGSFIFEPAGETSVVCPISPSINHIVKFVGSAVL